MGQLLGDGPVTIVVKKRVERTTHMTFPEGIKTTACGSNETGVKFSGRNVLDVMEDKPPSREIVKQSPDPP